MQFRFFSVVLVMLVALVLVGGVVSAQNTTQTRVERINSISVTRVVDVSFETPGDCGMDSPAGANMSVFANVNITWNDVPSYDIYRLEIGLYDADGTFLAEQFFLHIPGDEGQTQNREAWLQIGDAVTSLTRPLRIVVKDHFEVGSQHLASFVFDPADFIPECARWPYLDSAFGSINDPIIDTSSQNTAVFNSVDDDGNPSLDVYGINEDGEGYYLFTITQDDLAPFIDNPPTQNTEIESVGNVTLHVLTTGEFQLNIGPDEEGKVRVVIFDGLPPTNVYSYDFNVYDILEPVGD